MCHVIFISLQWEKEKYRVQTAQGKRYRYMKSIAMIIFCDIYNLLITLQMNKHRRCTATHTHTKKVKVKGWMLQVKIHIIQIKSTSPNWLQLCLFTLKASHVWKKHNKLRCHFDMDATKKKLYMHHCNIQSRITTQPSVSRFSYLIQFVG